MAAVYQAHGIEFMYPENWNLIEDSSDWPREICLESPTGGFWALHVYFPPQDPRRLAEDAREAIQAEYEHVEAEYVEEEIGTAAAEGYNMSFFYLDLLITCRARSFTVRDKTLVLITQAEDRDFAQLGPVFDAMTVSLMRNLVGES